MYVLQASEQASTETGDRDEKKKAENQQNSTHGHNLRDIFINDALCSQIETIIVWVIIRGRRTVDDIIKCDCDWSLYDGLGY